MKKYMIMITLLCSLFFGEASYAMAEHPERIDIHHVEKTSDKKTGSWFKNTLIVATGLIVAVGICDVLVNRENSLIATFSDYIVSLFETNLEKQWDKFTHVPIPMTLRERFERIWYHISGAFKEDQAFREALNDIKNHKLGFFTRHFRSEAFRTFQALKYIKENSQEGSLFYKKATAELLTAGQ